MDSHFNGKGTEEHVHCQILDVRSVSLKYIKKLVS